MRVSRYFQWLVPPLRLAGLSREQWALQLAIGLPPYDRDRVLLRILRRDLLSQHPNRQPTQEAKSFAAGADTSTWKASG